MRERERVLRGVVCVQNKTNLQSYNVVKTVVFWPLGTWELLV